MKKLFTLIIGAGLALAMQAQDITNTLGTGGFFNIESKSESNTKLMSVGNISAGSTNLTLFSFFNEPGLDTDLKIHNNGTTNLFINLMKARGIAGALENVENGDVLGTINFEGYHGNYHPSATISAVVNGAPGSHVPGELIFKTGSDTSEPVIRMTIDKSGTALFHYDAYIAGRTVLNGTVTMNDFLKLKPLANAPSGATVGSIYYDSTDNKVKVWTGSAWENLN